MSTTRKRIGILVFENFEPIDVWGFCQAFSIARFLGEGYAPNGAPITNPPFELILISEEESNPRSPSEPRPVKSYNGPRVVPDLFRNQALDRAFEQKFDVLMVPGGYGVWQIFQDSKRRDSVIRGLQEMAKPQRVKLMSSVCTGAALLAQAGLLDGKAAATNHKSFAWVAEKGPKVLWDNVARWVDAGDVVTSAGVSAGTDMGFYLVQRLAGRAVAELAALASEYDWHRDPQTPIFYPQQADIPVKP